MAKDAINSLLDSVGEAVDPKLKLLWRIYETGTPEPGGLDWYTLLKLIESVIREKNVVGMDVTELLPNPANKAPDFMAAKLIYRILSMVFAKKGEINEKKESL